MERPTAKRRLAYVAETEYHAWTNDGKLRHPSFKGLRDQVEGDGAEVYRLSE
jgi:bifunctional non-homologous end joining protein LigD